MSNTTPCTVLTFTTNRDFDVAAAITCAHSTSPIMLELQLKRFIRPTPAGPVGPVKNSDVGKITVIPLSASQANRLDPGKQFVNGVIAHGLNLMPKPLLFNHDDNSYKESQFNLTVGQSLSLYLDTSAGIGFIVPDDETPLAEPDDFAPTSGIAPMPLACQPVVDEVALAAKHNPKGDVKPVTTPVPPVTRPA